MTSIRIAKRMCALLRLSILVVSCLVSASFASDKPDDVLKQAEALRQQRQCKEAAALLAKQDLEAWPEAKRIEALKTQGLCESLAKFGPQAETTLRKVIAMQPANPDLWLLLGDHYVANLPEQTDEAMEAYRQALKLAGNSLGWQRFSAAVSLARMLTDEVYPNEALEVLQPFAKLRDVPPIWQIKIMRARGHALASAGRDAEALAEFRAALSLENETTKPEKPATK